MAGVREESQERIRRGGCHRRPGARQFVDGAFGKGDRRGRVMEVGWRQHAGANDLVALRRSVELNNSEPAKVGVQVTQHFDDPRQQQLLGHAGADPQRDACGGLQTDRMRQQVSLRIGEGEDVALRRNGSHELLASNAPAIERFDWEEWPARKDVVVDQ